MERITPYLRYYIGQFIEIKGRTGQHRICGFEDFPTPAVLIFAERLPLDKFTIRPVLRKVSSMVEKEVREFCKLEGWGENLENIVVMDGKVDFVVNGDTNGVLLFTRLRPEGFNYLINKAFWLFGNEAFEEGLIIEASKLNR